MWLFLVILLIAIPQPTSGQCCPRFMRHGFGNSPCGGCCNNGCQSQIQRPRPTGPVNPAEPVGSVGPAGPVFINDLVQPNRNNVIPQLPPQPGQGVVAPQGLPYLPNQVAVAPYLSESQVPPSPFAADEAVPKSLGVAAISSKCQALNCDFENNKICDFSSTTWKSATGRFQNPLTGVPKAATNDGYIATYVQPKEKNVLTSKDITLTTKATFSFQHFKATVGLEIKFCCDSETNCPWKSATSVSVSEKGNWTLATATCPEGTRRVIFVCENLGRNQGACAIDDLRCV
uniref:Uncharacterized protein n=1 Tax=Plectus sambesii TaxID=2011161 RepID=A0A914WEQ8_9BILA